MKHLYPTLAKDPNAVRSTGDQLATVRQRAARTAAQIYLAFCCNSSDYDIAMALDLKEASIARNLMIVRKAGENYFSIRRNELEAGGVLVHNCHSAGNPQPKRCACKLLASNALAKEMVACGEADWLWVYPVRAQAFETHGALVVTVGTKTPRTQTLPMGISQCGGQYGMVRKGQRKLTPVVLPCHCFESYKRN